MASGDGGEQEEPFDDAVEVRVEGEDGADEVRAVQLGHGPVELALAHRPAAVELDPRCLLLERDRDDDEARSPLRDRGRVRSAPAPQPAARG